ncbi:MAG: hypothetical protein JXB14_02540 [Candidatus Altiarchaeota archaeon]|nr:hypothetical protein [Candidatus Altiarchaeota archaeon]
MTGRKNRRVTKSGGRMPKVEEGRKLYIAGELLSSTKEPTGTSGASICHTVVFKSRDANKGKGAQTMWHIFPAYVNRYMNPEHVHPTYSMGAINEDAKREERLRKGLSEETLLIGGISSDIHPQRVVELVVEDLVTKGAKPGRIEVTMVPGSCTFKNYDNSKIAFESMRKLLKEQSAIRNVRTKGLGTWNRLPSQATRLREGQRPDWINVKDVKGSRRVISRPDNRTVWRDDMSF